MNAPRPIFLHGAIAGPSSWGSVPERFDGGAVLGLPGHPAGVPLGDADRLADWTALALGELDGPRVLIGQGLGAQLALMIAARHPDATAGVVAIGCAQRLRTPELPADPDAAIATLLAHSMGDPGGEFGQSLELAMQIVGPATLATDLGLVATIDVAACVDAIMCPVLVVVGDSDRWAPPEAAARLAASLTAGRMIVVEAAHHLIQADAPRTVELLIAGFLARVELTGADR
jgi:pimeloyl-ACP methyl ester carboxylesterase